MLSLLPVLAAVGVVTSSAVPPLGAERYFLRNVLEKRQAGVESCPISTPAPAVTAPYPNVWAQITPDDNLAVWNLLHEPATGLNLTFPSEATLTDNYVFWIDSLHTNKSSVLSYMNGGPLPAKYARAIIFFGGVEEPISQVSCYFIADETFADSSIGVYDWTITCLCTNNRPAFGLHI